MGIRAAVRVFEVKPDTILLWLRRAGEHCEKVSAYLMRNLHVEQAQLEKYLAVGYSLNVMVIAVVFPIPDWNRPRIFTMLG
jgi:hypothetical protein